MAEPIVSVVTPTRNRAHLLPRLVSALAAQDINLPVEYVIVDDASTDDTRAVLNQLRIGNPNLRLVFRDQRGGPGVARNDGWRAARGGMVAFTDDDCVPTTSWLRALVAALSEADIAQGAVIPDATVERGPFSRGIGVSSENGLYETCNVGYRRAWLERTGGFDPRYARSGEDADLAWRAIDLGATTAWAPDAVVHHDVQPSSWPRALADTVRWSGIVRLVAAHPHLWARFTETPDATVWRRAHRPAALGACGVALVLAALAQRRTVSAVGAASLGLPYLRYRLCQAPVSGARRERLRLLGPAWAIDVSEAVVIAATRLRLRLDAAARVPSRSDAR